MNDRSNEISERDIPLLIKNMKNSDVKWDGTAIGLKQKIMDKSLINLTKNKASNIETLLLDAIKDDERFVIAHVLLTVRSSESFRSSGREWNGLKVQLSASGETTYVGNNLDELYETWKKSIDENPPRQGSRL